MNTLKEKFENIYFGLDDYQFTQVRHTKNVPQNNKMITFKTTLIA